MEKTLTLYYAVNRSGQAHVFTELPERDDAKGIWVGRMSVAMQMAVIEFEASGYQLPLRRWLDDAVELNFTLKDAEG